MPRENVVALIPARGGSKGLPRKNLLPLGGVPLLAHSILQAQEAQHITSIFVSTEDDEIADVARRYGADVIRRPSTLADDGASSESALLHALECLESGGAVLPDVVAFLQCTSPLRTPQEIDGAIELLRNERADSLFSVSDLHGFVWQRLGDTLSALTYDPDARPRRQEIGRHWVENGSIYVFKPTLLRETGNRLAGRIVEYPMAPLSIFQIDTPQDLELHESLLPLHPWRPRPRGLESIRLLVLDFDGVLTDDRVQVREDGTESVLCHRGDGLGLEQLRQTEVEVIVLSKETNPVVTARCAKLGIDCVQGEDEKLTALQMLAADRDLSAEQIAFVGNDVNDLECIRWTGLGVAVADARQELLADADWITGRSGGAGAVREVCDLLMAAHRPQSDQR